MRARAFPTERTPAGSGVSGPGYHTAFLHVEDEDLERDGTGDPERRAQCLAEHDTLLTLLTLRWGEPETVSLWSAQARMIAGEEIPEPWADPVAGCEYLQLWRIEERWIAVGLHLENDGPGCELSVLVTVIDPP